MLITPEYAALNRQHLQESKTFGTGATLHVEQLRDLANILGTQDILDYGCGQGRVKQMLGWPIKEYDPCVPGKTDPPEPAEIVFCSSVLEHVEPHCLDAVLKDLRRCVKRCGFFIVPHNPALDNLPDGRNCHQIIEHWPWWRVQIEQYFTIHSFVQVGAYGANGHTMSIGSRTLMLVR